MSRLAKAIELALVLDPDFIPAAGQITEADDLGKNRGFGGAGNRDGRAWRAVAHDGSCRSRMEGGQGGMFYATIVVLIYEAGNPS